MCRLLGYSGPSIGLSDLLLTSNNSLVNQARTDQGYHPGERGERQAVDGDGFGFGFYSSRARPSATRFADVAPAWNNRNLCDLAGALESHHLVAHIRAAPPGASISRDNCHPFAHDQYLFAHNGWVGSMDKLRRRFYAERLGNEPLILDPYFRAIRGTTDSEVCFALLMSYLERVGGSGVERLENAVQETVTKLVSSGVDVGDEFGSKLNFVLCDGQSLVATRCLYVAPGAETRPWPFEHYDPTHALTLYTSAAARFELDADGNLRPRGVGERGAFLVASEPLTKPPQAGPSDLQGALELGWSSVGVNQMVSCSPEYEIKTERLSVFDRLD